MSVFVTRMVQPVNKMELVSLTMTGSHSTLFYATIEDGNIVVYPTNDTASVIKGSCILTENNPVKTTGATKIKSLSGDYRTYSIYQVTSDAVFEFTSGEGGGGIG